MAVTPEERDAYVQNRLDMAAQQIATIRDAMRDLHQTFDELVQYVESAKGAFHWPTTDE